MLKNDGDGGDDDENEKEEFIFEFSVLYFRGRKSLWVKDEEEAGERWQK